MSDIRRKIWDEIANYRDHELVQIAFAEFEGWNDDPEKDRHREDLFRAREQLRNHAVLTEEGRAQMWIFLATKRSWDQGAKQPRKGL